MDAERKFLYCVKAKVVGLYMYRLGCNLSLNIYAFGVHFMSPDISCRFLRSEDISSFAKKPKTSRTSLSLLNATTLIILQYHMLKRQESRVVDAKVGLAIFYIQPSFLLWPSDCPKRPSLISISLPLTNYPRD